MDYLATLMFRVYRDGFEFGRHGVAAAESVILVVYTIVLAILHRQVQNAIE